MATPHVAGIASLMLSVNPALTPAQVASKLSASARAFPVGTGADCTTAVCGAGIVDAAPAVLAAGGTVQPRPTTTALSSSANPASAGTAVTFTATVSGSSPSGSVAFSADDATLANCAAVALSVRNPSSATCSTSSLGVGTHAIVASYAANAASASVALSQSINPAADTNPPADVSAVSISNPAAGGQLNLSWVNPTADFAGVLILRRAGAPLSDVPASGQNYSLGQSLGASSVVYVGAATSYADTTLSNGTTYYYKIFAYDASRNYAAGVAGNGTPSAPAPSCAAELIIDNLAPGLAGTSGPGEVSFSGNWAQSGASGWYAGNGSLYSADDPSTAADTYTWRTPVLNAPQPCTYALYIWRTMHPNRSTSVPITVSGQNGGAATRTFNEQIGGSQWVLHGTYSFPAGARAMVQTSDASGQAAADAVRLVLVPGQ